MVRLCVGVHFFQRLCNVQGLGLCLVLGHAFLRGKLTHGYAGDDVLAGGGQVRGNHRALLGHREDGDVLRVGRESVTS